MDSVGIIVFVTVGKEKSVPNLLSLLSLLSIRLQNLKCLWEGSLSPLNQPWDRVYICQRGGNQHWPAVDMLVPLIFWRIPCRPRPLKNLRLQTSSCPSRSTSMPDPEVFFTSGCFDKRCRISRLETWPASFPACWCQRGDLKLWMARTYPPPEITKYKTTKRTDLVHPILWRSSVEPWIGWSNHPKKNVVSACFVESYRHTNLWPHRNLGSQLVQRPRCCKLTWHDLKTMHFFVRTDQLTWNESSFLGMVIPNCHVWRTDSKLPSFVGSFLSTG